MGQGGTGPRLKGEGWGSQSEPPELVRGSQFIPHSFIRLVGTTTTASNPLSTSSDCLVE